ncbi:MAG: 2-amino-4-hydroxy-6-hydroxymethyldihydropteridine diphosphokinase [Pseudomonadota bacterium]
MTEHWYPAFVGLGSNLAQPLQQLRRARRALEAMDGCRQLTMASVYCSAPMGPQDQPDYLNSAAGFLTTLPPQGVLRALQRIENDQGRQREQRWGARTLDLDLLMMPGIALDTDTLTLPHPGLPERHFVLQPLAELCPAVDVPGFGSVASLARCSGWQGLERLTHTL